MADKVVKIPGPNHPISIEANPSRVVVEVGGVYARWDKFDLRREMTTTLERELRRIMGIGAPKARAA